MAWLLLTVGGLLAGQMIYRWKKDIILTTVVCVAIALFGIWFGTVASFRQYCWSRNCQQQICVGHRRLVFCYFQQSADLEIRASINYVASYIVRWASLRDYRRFHTHPDFTLPAYTTIRNRNRATCGLSCLSRSPAGHLRMAQHCFEFRDSRHWSTNRCPPRGRRSCSGDDAWSVRLDHRRNNLCLIF